MAQEEAISGKRVRKHSVLRCILTVLACTLATLLVAAGIILVQFTGKVANVQRLDDAGLLYKVDYVGSYDNPLYNVPLRFLQAKSCTTFTFENAQGNKLTARNYDFPHKDAQGNLTGLNVVVELAPEGRYRSINVADVALLGFIDKQFSQGALDTGAANSPLMALLPYLCMDGMNEKGLVCSIMFLDTRSGEKAAAQSTAGKPDVVIVELLRYLLDTCATTDEAVAFASMVNMHGVLGGDYHLLVNDAAGHSVVLEWQNNELQVVESDASTNFYLSSDDAQDSYSRGTLREAWTGPASTKRMYTYGYGHGYERFKTVVTTLDAHRTTADEPAVLTEEQARDTLAQVAQSYVQGVPTSMTQYSALYNASEFTLDVWVQQDYEHCYSFTLD